MRQYKKQLAILATFGVLGILMLITGIPLIAVFAGKNWIVMTVGIVFTVFGFYGTPMFWVAFGTTKTKERILYLILEENIYSLIELGTQIGQSNLNVLRETVRTMIAKGYLKGFLLKDDYLILNENIKQTKKQVVGICSYCGGKTVIDGEQGICAYCGGVVENPLLASRRRNNDK